MFHIPESKSSLRLCTKLLQADSANEGSKDFAECHMWITIIYDKHMCLLQDNGAL